MPLSLPAAPARARSLDRVLEDAIDAVRGVSDRLPPARSAIVLVVDGLGVHNLRARAAYARFLAPRLTKGTLGLAPFPSTTATALTSLLTGVDAGIHGVVGYRAFDPERGRAVNQLTGWDDDGLDPHVWQRAQPIFEREAAAGRSVFVVSKPEYRATGFTEATLRGARVFGERALEDRVRLARELARGSVGAIVYLYVPELDALGHRLGSESEDWALGLERVDALARMLDETAEDVGVLLTADHGMIDVPAHRHILLGDDAPELDGVLEIAGEPRMLQLRVEPGAVDAVRARWARHESSAWVFTRDEAIRAGLFGTVVDADVAARLGDVLVAARPAVAFYDDRGADRSAQRMVGQHGSLTLQERVVPLLKLGAFA